MKKGKFFSLTVVAILVALFCVASVGLAAEKKDTLVVANIYDAKTLDPQATNDVASSGAMMQIYETLVALDDDNNVVPQLAEKWEKLDDLTYKFYLLKGVKFHNGEELKASDVKYTIDRAMSPKGAAIQNYSGEVEKVEVLDDYTLIIKTKKPSTPFLASLSHTWGSIMNAKAVEEAGDNYGMHPIGTGPFKFLSWAKGDRLTLERFEDFHGKKPAYKTLVMRSITEPTSRTIELESGAVDIAYQITTNDIKRVEENPNLKLMRVMDNSTSYLGFNCEKAPFDNVKVRQAINLAIDTVGINKAVYRGIGQAPTGPIAPNVKYFDKSQPVHEQDMETAKKLLEEAGYKDGFKAQIWTNDKKERVDMATIIQSQLSEIGIDVEIKVLEWGAYLDGLKAKQHDMFIVGWVSTVPDPEFAVGGVFHSSMKGKMNFSFFGDPKVDELIEKGKTLPDGADREAVYVELQKELNEKRPWVYLLNDEQICGMQKNVKGFRPSPRGYHELYNVYFED
ncbi:MAG: ABC transporter substrate-binding protein [Aminobacterium sp.]|jgi:peptide/nickel transport system substrate-binding protein|nr:MULTISPECIES: ABC transporter substrate-binding protein [unclassified Aminobacterium]MDD2205729.1 ABC transporter substrate-binding protein [Aminobacterium sp.]MDD3707923.1 ABC transporter substrate-binding protein [Aminobacterium sp.]MDD4229248.1 ABC transporter substrate-binding protein [Aminobacterium sp.]MDD4551975.1 ABC transporter substrate-binding protein [Aminobacterium sp.]MEA4878240.1 ABC transporter substrate-binding protein [Aminobacterium sp.]